MNTHFNKRSYNIRIIYEISLHYTKHLNRRIRSFQTSTESKSNMHLALLIALWVPAAILAEDSTVSPLAADTASGNDTAAMNSNVRLRRGPLCLVVI